MPEYLHPGVFVEEVSSGVRPIEGVGTSTAAFIGVTAKGIPNKARFITSWSEFVRHFGSFIPHGYLPYAVSHFFTNGGRRCYIVRVLNEPSAGTAAVELPDRETDQAPQATLTVRAKGAGAWGNDLVVRVEDDRADPTGAFRLVVYHEGRPVEFHEALSMDPASHDYVESVVNDASEYIEVADRRVYAAATRAKLTSDNALDPTPALNGETLVLETPDGVGHEVSFTADPSREDLVTRLNAEWGPLNVAVSLDDGDRLVIEHNAAGYENYFRISGTGVGAPASGEPVRFALDASGAAFARGSGPAAPGVLKSDVAAPTYTITDGDALTLTVNIDGGTAIATITHPFDAADNGGSEEWAPSAVANALQQRFRDQHDGILEATTEGSRVVVRSANRGRHDSEVVASGAANAALGFAPADRIGATASGLGLSEPAFLESAEGPFALEKDSNLFIVVNNDENAAELEGGKRIRVRFTDATIANFQQVTPEEVRDTIDAATSEDATVDASDHVEASVVDGRVFVHQKRRGNHFSIRVEDGVGRPNIALKFQAQRQRGRVQGDPTSPYYRPGLNLVAGVNEPFPLTAGSDGSPVSDFDHVGTADKKNGLHALDDVDDVNFIAIPGNASPNVIGEALGYCAIRKDCFFIADAPGKRLPETPLTEPPMVQDFVRNGLPVKSSYGALYYPWLEIADPIGAGRNPRRFVPPSGAIAGIFARIDTARGVWKAPAGTEAGVIGAIGLEYSVTDAEQDVLHPFGVNCIRRFAASGMVVWGARTLATQSDPEWRYVPVRRYALYLEESILEGTQWAVHEPNDPTLWDSLRSNIEDFLMGEFRRGALAGATPEQAFDVKCDVDLNPPSEVNAGRVNMEVKFAPLKPAEFVIIRISQKIQRPEG